MNNYFYGIRGIKFISHGEWADPELIWHKHSFNYYDVETPLWEAYREECSERGKRPDENIFEIWVKKNAYLARECLQNLLEWKHFYNSDVQMIPF